VSSVANGRLPASALAKIPGGQLAKPYAAHWNVMCFLSRAREGSCPMPNGPMSSYRTLSQQVFLRRQWCNQGKCHNAAVPGTSNHGWGRAVDNNNLAQAYRNGKTCGVRPPSDAPWENWHALVRLEGASKPPAPRVIRKGSRPGPDIKALQVLLRRAGYLPKKWKVHDRYTLPVRRAVRAFQKDHKLRVDGVVGPKTLAAIKRAAKK
jgi:murein L,D-transpeptidase YcbB/YkuD